MEIVRMQPAVVRAPIVNFKPANVVLLTHAPEYSIEYQAGLVDLSQPASQPADTKTFPTPALKHTSTHSCHGDSILHSQFPQPSLL